MSRKPGLIVALDDADLDSAEALAKELSEVAWAFKVGLTLFASAGPQSLTRLGKFGRVFCDLKLNDIPQQVGRAAGAIAAKGAWMLTVHASAGEKAMEAAVDAAELYGCVVAGVTVLTSLSPVELEAVGQGEDPEAQVERLARLTVRAGAGAIVCSGEETRRLRSALGNDVLLITPGVRPSGSDIGDQSRVVTPSDAAAAGSDYVVVGRPVTSSPDPYAAAVAILEEMRSS